MKFYFFVPNLELCVKNFVDWFNSSNYQISYYEKQRNPQISCEKFVMLLLSSGSTNHVSKKGRSVYLKSFWACKEKKLNNKSSCDEIGPLGLLTPEAFLGEESSQQAVKKKSLSHVSRIRRLEINKLST